VADRDCSNLHERRTAVLAALTAPAAQAAEPFNSSLFGMAAVSVYLTSCGKRVPPKVIKLIDIITRPQRKAYGELLGEVWQRKQQLGDEQFCRHRHRRGTDVA
jgi:hypothetical protein